MIARLGMSVSERVGAELGSDWGIAMIRLHAMEIDISEGTLRFLKGSGWSLESKSLGDFKKVELREGDINHAPRRVAFYNVQVGGLGIPLSTRVDVGWDEVLDNGSDIFRRRFGFGSYNFGNTKEIVGVNGVEIEGEVIKITGIDRDDIGQTRIIIKLLPNGGIHQLTEFESHSQQKLTDGG